jgi:hypothetical protein
LQNHANDPGGLQYQPATLHCGFPEAVIHAVRSNFGLQTSAIRTFQPLRSVAFLAAVSPEADVHNLIFNSLLFDTIQ